MARRCGGQADPRRGAEATLPDRFPTLATSAGTPTRLPYPRAGLLAVGASGTAGLDARWRRPRPRCAGWCARRGVRAGLIVADRWPAAASWLAMPVVGPV